MKILVGMSGGLDSTYAAYKLIEEGHSVEGALVVMHEHTDIDGAREASEALGIKLHVIDASERFLAVKENFVSEYSLGRTPNPCIVCNPLVKFRALADFAKENGFDRIATGHYARVVEVNDGEKLLYTLMRSRDQRKDQTYMLYRLPRDILSILILPLGDELKSEIKQKAQNLGMKAASKRESQEICFIPDGDYASYIEGIRGVFPEGDFVLSDGRVVGKHKGIIHYTVGQRKGLGVAFGERIFVSRIDPMTNSILLSTEGSYTDEVEVRDINFTGIQPPEAGAKLRAEVKLRYLAKPVSATVCFDGKGGATLKLDEAQKAVAPGQSAVVYDADTLLFGGFIE